ncbi:flagellar hook-length control protein FliK [Bradyrhizobium diazoefficiens]|nr:flagellar hook-length control protein FliK [Bradyrhizobium diazoefficiens]MBR0776509.1 flagellar hook-length control protein FliK [Bradyrhizobium diazoefficiens]
MTKLNGTSGQVFAGLAESLARGISRSGKGAGAAGAKAANDSSFHDLLHTVSHMAKRALNDDGTEATAKPASLHPRPAALTGHDKPRDEAVHARTDAADDSKPDDEAPDKQAPIDLAAKVDVLKASNIATIVGQELAAVPAARPQLQLQAGDRKDTAARDERSSELRGASQTKAATADGARSGAAPATVSSLTPTVARPQGDVSQAMSASPEGGEAASKAMPVTPGFEAVAANVEHAAKAAAREALPGTIKVNVVQQETHLPPVAQFSPPQQIADAVVTELQTTSASASTAAPDPASQSNAPDQPLRILTINLEPPALGNVTVRLRLVGTEVSVHLAAERKDTSQMLDQQRDSIRELMQSAGYVADVAPVQHGSLDGFQAGSGQQQPQFAGQHQQSPQSQASFDGASTSSGQSQGDARQTRQDQQPSQETRHDNDVAPQLRRGPVYL